MALTVLNRQGLPELFGQALGQGIGGFGQGIGQGLTALANIKINELVSRQQKQQKAKALQAAGLPAEYVDLPDNLLAVALKNKLEEPQNRAFTQALFGGMGGQQEEQQQPFQQQFSQPQYQEMAQQQPPQFQQPNFQNLLAQGAGQGVSPVQSLMQSLGQQQQPQMQQQQMEQVPQEFNQPEFQQQKQQPVNRRQAVANVLKQTGAALSPQKLTTLNNIISQQEKLDQKAQELLYKAEKVEQGRTESVRKASEPYKVKADAAKKNIRDYNLLIKVAKAGDIRAGKTHQLLKKVGLEDFGANFNTQIATKLIGRLSQNAQAAFGTGKITNFLEQTFQRSLPGLWNTPEGIIAISKLNKYTDQGEVVKDDIRAKLVKKYKGRIPYDFDDKINEAAEPKLKDLENKSLKVLENAAGKQSGEKLGKSFDTLQAASEFPGKAMYTPDGIKIRSNGTQWIREDNGTVYEEQ